ncbi:3'-5' exonuclease [Leptolyngbya sp. CCY15150]|uniref:3'-5' exonuclease n=1 Tax=Leptolyngbya sp. CCY15150 TaxID=2767772 RepID=UPI00194E8920|nr:3'-5' exonuclease [Leptolyngbya sp. CCY15150]
MNVLICKSLFQSLVSLSGTEVKRANDFILKFQDNPAQPSLSLERITKTKNDNLWSARITQDLRAVIYKDGDTWALLHAGHHDAAYHWASNRNVELNNKTGALQIVEVVESVEEIVPRRESWQVGLFDAFEDDYLLSLGVPNDWLPVLRQLITADDLLNIIERLPEEVSERLLQLASGELVAPPVTPTSKAVAENADTQRRFITVKSQGELEKMLQAPLATWIGFLHPSQRRLVIGHFNGPVKVTGSAGTGKTVVALHRARHLARQGKKVLLTTFVNTLCDNLKHNLQLLCTPEELDNITVTSVASQASSVLGKAKQGCRAISDSDVKPLLELYRLPSCPLDIASIWQEWRLVIQPHGILTWDEYRSVSRKGRGTSLTVRDRRQVWQVLEKVLAHLDHEHKADWGHYFRQASDVLVAGLVNQGYDAVIVDEVQDLRPQELRFLATLAGDGPNRFMMVGDGGQRIYQGKFSLKSLGINVQGRSRTLKINYRTTEQIRRFADRITDLESDDLDGSRETRKGTVSLLQGPEPILTAFDSSEQQAQFVAKEVLNLTERGLLLSEIGIFARTRYLLSPVQEHLQSLQIPYTHLNSQDNESDLGVRLGTMHRAKGLEFKAVFAIDLSDNILPLPKALLEASDDEVKAESIELERHLLYVTITRARDFVYLCWQGNPTQFLVLPNVK